MKRPALSELLIGFIAAGLWLIVAVRGYLRNDLATFWGFIGLAIVSAVSGVAILVRGREKLRKGVMIIYIAGLVVAVRYLLLSM